MFQSFQGSPSVEVFTPGGKFDGKESISYWKLTGVNKDKDKIFDNDVKSFVINMEGNNATTKMETRLALLLVQRFLVLQLLVPVTKDFCIDLGLKDMQKGRRRVTLSTTTKEKQKTPLHAKYSLGLIKRSSWMNLCVDLVSLMGETWEGQTLQSLDSICIAGNCRLRRIFTMKAQLRDTTDDEDLYGFGGTNDENELDSLPRMYMVGKDNLHLTQVINMKKLYYYEKFMSAAPTTNGQLELDLGASGDGRRKYNAQDQSRIAFGSKVSSQQQASSSRENSAHAGHQKSSRREKVHYNRQNSAENSSHRSHNRDGSARVSSREGSAQKGNSSRENSAKKVSSNQEDLTRTRILTKDSSRRGHIGDGDHGLRGASSREGSAHRDPSSREGSGHKRSTRDGSAYRGSSREGSAQKGGSSREGSGHTRSVMVKDQLTARHQNVHHSRSKSDTVSDYASARRPQSSRSKSHRTAELRKAEHGRDRTDSDPGTLKGDPEVTVDKESLRSSHTWTDGADGAEKIPFVKPHPPAEPNPSSGKNRRTRRVRSAGKERTPHAGHVEYIDSSGRGNGQEPEPVAQPSVVANADEEDDIMRAMQESYAKSVNKKYDSTTSEENSYGREETDEIQQVLEALRYHQARSDTSDTTTGGKEYEESEEDDLSGPNKTKDKVYTFASKPNVLPHNKNAVLSHNHRTRSRDRALDNRRRNHSEQRVRRRPSRDRLQSKSDEENISINLNSLGEVTNLRYNQRTRNGDQSQLRRKVLVAEPVSAPSSEEEPKYSQSRNRKQRSPRHKPQKPYQNSNLTPRNLTPRNATPRNLTPRNKTDSRHRTKNGPSSRYENRDDKMTNGDVRHVATTSRVGFHLHDGHLGATDEHLDTLSSHQPLSISRKSLREIPGPTDELRRSGGARPYDPSAYQMAELSDSAELQILQNLRSQDKSNESSTSENESDHTQKNTVEFREDLHYRRHSDSEEEMTTSSTLRHSLFRQPHNYQEEMEMGRSMRDSLNATDPRAWTKVFSPVLPNSGTVPNSHQPNNYSSNQVVANNPRTNGYGSYSDSTGTTQTDDEEELDLLYDPVLNCYYDPKTNKYYELV